jgi:hypothetical protein
MRGLDVEQQQEATDLKGQQCFVLPDAEMRKECFDWKQQQLELKQEVDMIKQQLHVALIRAGLEF